MEKCISRRVEEGRKMVEAARKYGRVVQAGTQHRSGPYMAAGPPVHPRGQARRGVLREGLQHARRRPTAAIPDRRSPIAAPAPASTGTAGSARRPSGPTTPRSTATGTAGGISPAATLRTASTSSTWRGCCWASRRTRASISAWAAAGATTTAARCPTCRSSHYQWDKLALSFENTGFSPVQTKTPEEDRRGRPHAQLAAKLDCGSRSTARRARCSWAGISWAGRCSCPAARSRPSSSRPTRDDPLPEFHRLHQQPQTAHRRRRICPHGACLEHLGTSPIDWAIVRSGSTVLPTETFKGNEEANACLKAAGRKHYRIPDVI